MNDPIQHRALCPRCGRLAIRETHKTYPNGLPVSLYMCERGHSWLTKWLEGGAA